MVRKSLPGCRKLPDYKHDFALNDRRFRSESVHLSFVISIGGNRLMAGSRRLFSARVLSAAGHRNQEPGTKQQIQ